MVILSWCFHLVVGSRLGGTHRWGQCKYTHCPCQQSVVSWFGEVCACVTWYQDQMLLAPFIPFIVYLSLCTSPLCTPALLPPTAPHKVLAAPVQPARRLTRAARGAAAAAAAAGYGDLAPADIALLQQLDLLADLAAAEGEHPASSSGNNGGQVTAAAAAAAAAAAGGGGAIVGVVGGVGVREGSVGPIGGGNIPTVQPGGVPVQSKEKVALKPGGVALLQLLRGMPGVVVPPSAAAAGDAAATAAAEGQPPPPGQHLASLAMKMLQDLGAEDVRLATQVTAVHHLGVLGSAVTVLLSVM